MHCGERKKQANIMNKFLIFSTVISILTFTGCTHSKQIIIDPKDNNMEHYQADLAECRQIAEQVESKTAENAVEGAVIGAIFGAIVGGHDSSITGAQVGALSGGLEGNSKTQHTRIKVVKNCLRNRGYRVLN